MSINNPYKGLFPYTAEDEPVFFGRDKEAADLIQMIKHNQLVILYGESGTGKTSLIHAKLFPELKRQYSFPIYIRINYMSGEDPLFQVRTIIYNKLTEWDSTVPKFEANQSLIEYVAKTSVFNGMVKPVLFFDQFEELFTLGSKYNSAEKIEELINQLSDLIEIRFPVIEKKRDTPNDESEEEKCKENVLRFTVVFSLRQDYIAQLDDLRFKIPSLNNNRYRIKKFTAENALEAILGPVRALKKGVITNDDVTEKEKEAKEIIIAGKIVEQLKLQEISKSNLFEEFPNTISEKNILKGLFVMGKIFEEKPERIFNEENYSNFLDGVRIDPTILSLYCYQLYEESSLVDGIRQISSEQVSRSSTKELIKNYYNASLSITTHKYAIENLLITTDGRRILMPLKTFIANSKMTEADVENLKKQSAIIRIYGEKNREIELAHDQIARTALISRKQREANTIKRNARIILSSVMTFVGLAIIALIFYVREKEKSVNIISLQEKTHELTLANEKKQDSISNLLDRYSAALTNTKGRITDNEEINKQIYLINNQFNEEKAKNKSLTNQYDLVESAYEKVKDSLFKMDLKTNNYVKRYNELLQQIKEYNELKIRLNNLEDKNKKFESYAKFWAIKYPATADSLYLASGFKNLSAPKN